RGECRSRGRAGLTAGQGAVWVTTVDERLLRIDPRDGKQTAELTLPTIGYARAVAADSVWLTLWLDDGQVWRVDPDTAATMDTISSRFPSDLAVGAHAPWVAQNAPTVT